MSKFTLILTVILFVFTFVPKRSSTYAQVIYFCENVNKIGYPEKESSSFKINRGGVLLKFLVRVDDEIDCHKVKFVIYKVSYTGNENHDTTIYQDVEKNWLWFWKEISFANEGKYNVYVYDQYDNFLTSGAVKINYQ